MMPDIADCILSFEEPDNEDFVQALQAVVAKTFRESLFEEVYHIVQSEGQQFIDRGYAQWYTNRSRWYRFWFKVRKALGSQEEENIRQRFHTEIVEPAFLICNFQKANVIRRYELGIRNNLLSTMYSHYQGQLGNPEIIPSEINQYLPDRINRVYWATICEFYNTKVIPLVQEYFRWKKEYEKQKKEFDATKGIIKRLK